MNSALNGLARLVAFPSVSGSSAHAAARRACAHWLADQLQRIGLEHVRLAPPTDAPLVQADWRHAPGRPTVLIYGHYDVQPPGPLDQWHSPPFIATRRGNWLFGRGVSDDKGQLYAHLQAIEALLRMNGWLPVNLVCLFEGEEEVGSPGLQRLLRQRPECLGADVVVISDSQIQAPDRPAITLSMRGALGMELQVEGARRELHSGVYGGAVGNAAHVLSKLLAGLHAEDGRIAVAGFYDQVQPPGMPERAFMARQGLTNAQILREAPALPSVGEVGYSLYERSTIRPALNVNAIECGAPGRDWNAAIPARASARIDIRLVPGQQPDRMAELLQRHLEQVIPPGFRIRLRRLMSANAFEMDPGHPAIAAAAAAYRQGFGVEPAFVRNGGSIPVAALFRQSLGLPVVLLGFGLPGDRIHGRNERLHLPMFQRAIEASRRFMIALASLQGYHWSGRPLQARNITHHEGGSAYVDHAIRRQGKSRAESAN